MATQENLKAGFAGESQANRKYLIFAKKAEADGFPQVAKLFRAAAEAEAIHAQAQLRVMGGIKSTAENLQTAINGEEYEFKTMYPGFLKDAQAEKNNGATVIFKYAAAVEKVHYDLYSKALEMVKSGKDVPAQKMYVCKVCGHTVYGEAEDKCAVCGAAKTQFIEIV